MKVLFHAAIVAALPLAAQADTLFSSKGQSNFRSKVSVLDGRAAGQYEGSTRLQPRVDAGPEKTGRTVTATFGGRYRGQWLEPARAAARRHGIPEGVFLRLVQRESGWNPVAVSHKGAVGLAQLMPSTAQLLQVDAADPAQNLEGGARYLARQFRRFGDWRLALAAYNAGPGAVERHGGVPPYAETTAYVAAILGD